MADKHVSQKVQYPWGEVSKIPVTAGATMSATVWNNKTQIDISEMAAAGTLNLAIDPAVRVGAQLRVKVSADGTNRTLTLGTGLEGNALTVSAGKKFNLLFEFDGEKFSQVSTQQLN
ncbi:MAG: hypothetical protein M9892_04580 [Bacteroidetes bacterium]|nr:hypothetical protein [Bacteroidota bacterium]